MIQGRTVKYFLPLMALALACVLVLSIGDTRARYNTGVLWSGMIKTDPLQTDGGLLLPEGQRVLLRDLDLESTRTIPLTFSASGGTVTGELTCRVRFADSGEDASAWLTAALDRQALQIGPNGTETVNLTLTATDAARQVRDTAIPLVITVTWIDGTTRQTMTADFVTMLPPVEDVEDPSEEETPEEAGSEEESGDETAGEENENDDQEAPEAEDQPFADAHISIMPQFSLQGKLALQITVPEGYTDLQLRMLDTGSPVDFPAHTQYRINGGAQTLLLDGGEILLSGAEDGVYTVLLDLSDTGLDGSAGDLTLVLRGVLEGQSYVCQATASPSLDLPADPARSLAPILTNSGAVEVAVVSQWGGCEMGSSLAFLQTAEDGSGITWTPVDPTGVFILSVEADPNGDTAQPEKLVIRTGRTAPEPGTYRLTLTWTFAGLTVCEREVVFFVNYSGYSVFESTGGTV